MKFYLLTGAIVCATLSGCATFEGDRSSNSVLSSNNDPVILFSEEQERALGLESAKAALQQYKPLENPAVQSYVSALGKRLAKVSDRPGLDYQFTVVDSPE